MSVRRNLDLAVDQGAVSRLDEIAATAREPQGARIAIALCSHETVPVEFATNLAMLTMFSAANMPDGVTLGVNLIQGTYIHVARQEMIENLMADGVTHILWVDTDMTFPADALIQLLHRKKSVVGINYPKRTFPTEFVAIKELGDDHEKLGKRLKTTEASTGLEEVEAMGFGLVLMRIDALNALPFDSDQPFFGFEWWPNRRQWVGEDVYFWNLLRAGGVEIFVDHDLSKQCGHIGLMNYRPDQAADWAVEQGETE